MKPSCHFFIHVIPDWLQQLDDQQHSTASESSSGKKEPAIKDKTASAKSLTVFVFDHIRQNINNISYTSNHYHVKINHCQVNGVLQLALLLIMCQYSMRPSPTYSVKRVSQDSYNIWLQPTHHRWHLEITCYSLPQSPYSSSSAPLDHLSTALDPSVPQDLPTSATQGHSLSETDVKPAGVGRRPHASFACSGPMQTDLPLSKSHSSTSVGRAIGRGHSASSSRGPGSNWGSSSITCRFVFEVVQQLYTAHCDFKNCVFDKTAI